MKRHAASVFIGRAVIVLLLLSQPFVDGCSPILLTSRVDKGFVVIKTSDLEAGKRLF